MEIDEDKEGKEQAKSKGTKLIFLVGSQEEEEETEAIVRGKLT